MKKLLWGKGLVPGLFGWMRWLALASSITGMASEKMKPNGHHFALYVAIAFSILVGKVSAAPVSEDVIRQVAANYISNHINLMGNWNGKKVATVARIQLITYRDQPVAYHVTVNPSGYLFMAYDDDFSPVLLYSPTSEFDPRQVDVQGSPESWIIPETFAVYQDLQKRRPAIASGGAAIAATNQERLQSRSSQAWHHFNRSPEQFAPQTRVDPLLNKSFSASATTAQAAAVGPLLSTSWNQGGSTYNLYTPSDSASPSGPCAHTPTGCVATATAQLMKYWNWPAAGTGSHSYSWLVSATPALTQTLSADFNHSYNWSIMPNALTGTSTNAQIEAVARLMSDVGIAANMAYDCEKSGANLQKVATTVLPNHFKYKKGASSIYRTSYTAPAFFSLIKAELDASPPRPMLFQMFTLDRSSGHAVVVDGYQSGVTDMAHINLGWGGSYTAYYDITNNWTTGSRAWSATSQGVFTHIEPDTAASCFASISSVSQYASAAGLTGGVTVTVSPGCIWAASSNVNWINITSGATGNSGNGTVSYSVAVNPSTSSRTGTLTIAGQLFTVTQAGSGGVAANLLVNPGFESDSTAWIESSTGGFPNIYLDATIAHTGSYVAWLGGYVSGTDTIAQKVTIPSNAQTASLQFWFMGATNETSASYAYDNLTVNLYDGATGAFLNTLKTLSNLDANATWSLRSSSFDVSGLRGQSVYVGFIADNDSTLPTSFFIDDTSLTISTGTSVLPSAPLIGSATAGNASVSVGFTPTSIGSGTLVGYWAACSNNNFDFVYVTGSSSPIMVPGLSNDTTYLCYAMTRSTVGDSAWSSQSNSATPLGLPDLIVTTVTAPGSGQIGGNVYVEATAMNQGNVSAGSIRLNFYLSTNSTISTSDINMNWGCTITTLAPGQSYSCVGNIPIPSTTPTGTYYFGAIADANRQVPESNEVNNSLAASNNTVISNPTTLISQTISFTNPGPKTMGTAPFTLSASGGASGNPVTFTSQANTVCTVSDSTVTLVAAGTCTIAANQVGNATYNAAPLLTQSFAVSKVSQTIGTIGLSPSTLRVGGIIVASATATSGLAVTFNSSLTTSTCTVSGSTVTGITAGTCTVAANQAGNANYSAAPQVTQNITVAATARLINLSTRGQVQTGDNVMIGGFIISGTTPKKVLVRAVGPNLANYGVSGVLLDPSLQLFSGQTAIASNDDWGSASNVAEIQASGFAPVNGKESAILSTLNPGAYTAIVSGNGGGTGVGIVEVYELDHPEIPLVNISTRGKVQTGDNVMIGGFIIQGDAAKTVLIRAVGPNLANYGVTGVLANPKLQLYSGQTVIASNDDWGTSANAADITATGLAPVNPLESAILITLQPGAYTAIVSGADGGSGVGIVEVFAQ